MIAAVEEVSVSVSRSSYLPYIFLTPVYLLLFAVCCIKWYRTRGLNIALLGIASFLKFVQLLVFLCFYFLPPTSPQPFIPPSSVWPSVLRILPLVAYCLAAVAGGRVLWSYLYKEEPEEGPDPAGPYVACSTDEGA